ncbi:MAG: hypothetical protein QOE70_6196 [Chthoniobacter sp.]|jgi:putative SOS response-associated peptidase YedK|nr:hypothetical protein [Chthoniobacter sp.]
MCGRYRLTQAERFAELNNLEFRDGLPADEFSDVRLGGRWKSPRYNICPDSYVAAVLDTDPRSIVPLRWGLVPPWSPSPKREAATINVRAETVSKAPSFRAAWKKRRCLIPADGLYEWKKITEKQKQPYDISMRGGEPFAFAGLWEIWWPKDAPEGTPPLRTCTIITAEPNELVAQIHNRQAVILPRERYAAWLSPDTSEADRLAMLEPYPSEGMTAHPISTRVNKPGDDDPTLIEEVPPATAFPTRPQKAKADDAQGDLFG